jgi:polysaccharide pyruvyl transferase WcaK-like protein
VIVHRFRESYFPYVGAHQGCVRGAQVRSAPDIVFTHRRDDEHQDHRTLAQLTWNTFRNHFIAEYEIPKYEGDLGHPNLYVPLERGDRRPQGRAAHGALRHPAQQALVPPGDVPGADGAAGYRVRLVERLGGGLPHQEARPVSASSGRTALFGLFGVGNIGNEASLASAIQAIRRRDPDAELVVVCAVPTLVRTEHGVDAVPIAMSGPVPRFGRLPRVARAALRPIVELARWIAAWRFIRTVDRIVVPGTGILDDFGMSPWEMPWDLVRWSSLARLRRRPFVMLSIGAGPIENSISRRFARWTVRNSIMCTYRDETSREFMAELGCLGGPDSVQPDLVFTLDRPTDRRVPGGRKCIGVGLMAYYGWSNSPVEGAQTLVGYVDRMTDVVVRIVDAGRDVLVLVGEGTDEHAVDALRKRLVARRPGALRHVTTPRIDSVPALLTEIARTDGVVATRYHNVVGALMMHRPVVAIAYADKHHQLLDGAGVPGDRRWIDAIEPEAIVADLDKQLAEAERVSEKIAVWDAAQREAVERQYDRVFGDHR